VKHGPHFVRPSLAVSGYRGVTTREALRAQAFVAQLQLATFPQPWLPEELEVGAFPFRDGCTPPPETLRAALDWSTRRWPAGRLLVSCAAGQSRSVSLCVGILIEREGVSLVDAAHEVIAGVPRARPHPLVLVGVARACGHDPDLAQLREIYDALDLETHELGWPDASLRAALEE
jgi:hypothetical protein